MGNTNGIIKINYEDIQYAINNKIIIINTLNTNQQNCLIKNTICIEEETELINSLLQNYKMSEKIIIYGKNSNDHKIFDKYEQLIKLGFRNVYLYTGGLFEWLCLQDIYGSDNFPTTTDELDLLKYKAPSLFNDHFLLQNID